MGYELGGSIVVDRVIVLSVCVGWCLWGIERKDEGRREYGLIEYE